MSDLKSGLKSTETYMQLLPLGAALLDAPWPIVAIIAGGVVAVYALRQWAKVQALRARPPASVPLAPQPPRASGR